MTGRYIQAFLDESKIHHISIQVRKATRTCTTVLDKRTGEMTELIEPAGKIELHEREQLEHTAREVIANSPKMEAIALCGTLPPGTTGSTYTMIAELKPPSVILLLDAYQNAECLKTGKVDILKINAEEARSLASMSEDVDLVDVGRRLHSMFSVRIIAVTNGPDEACLFEVAPRQVDTPRTMSVTFYKLPDLLEVFEELDDVESLSSSPLAHSLPEATGEPSPFLLMAASKQKHSGSSFTSQLNGFNKRERGKHEIVINPLGAGDTCSSIFLVEYLDTQDAALAFRHGLAAASASCLVVDSTSHFDLKVKKALFERIVPRTEVLPLSVHVE
ncbi:hypothetical protein HK105_203146 [Polyrhizophydium stewartii]|uniref:Carbohydrate kinase PfkB domain-containing protein n=1 Tax=Polyrhizophydium stewartii TaxID=2732419 RepID=A0ABR4ND80_9FUNG